MTKLQQENEHDETEGQPVYCTYSCPRNTPATGDTWDISDQESL